MLAEVGRLGTGFGTGTAQSPMKCRLCGVTLKEGGVIVGCKQYLLKVNLSMVGIRRLWVLVP